MNAVRLTAIPLAIVAFAIGCADDDKSGPATNAPVAETRTSDVEATDAQAPAPDSAEQSRRAKKRDHARPRSTDQVARTSQREGEENPDEQDAPQSRLTRAELRELRARNKRAETAAESERPRRRERPSNGDDDG